MSNIGNVQPSNLIGEVAKEFKTKLQKPDFADWVKTGVSREKAPLNRDWWFTRAASVLYRIYTDGPLGTESLRSYYGGKKRRGVRPPKFRKASGKIIRLCLQQLEKEGYIKKLKKGRSIAPKGVSYLEKKAKEIYGKDKEKREEKARKLEERRKLVMEQAESVKVKKPVESRDEQTAGKKTVVVKHEEKKVSEKEHIESKGLAESEKKEEKKPEEKIKG